MNHPYLDPSFLVSWSRLTPEAIRPDITEAISRAKENIRTICDQPLESLTYESTFGALEKASEDLHLGWGRIMHLDSVNDEPAQREAIGEMLPEVVAFSSSVPLNPRLWTVLKAAASCDWVKSLSPVRQRFIQETLADFRESGADLPDDVKPEYAEIEAQLSLKTKKFAENVLDSTNAWELIVEDEAELSGLPDSAKEAARLDALANGHGTEEAPRWRFTQKFTSLQPVMQFADSDSLRRRMWEGSCSIGKGGEYDNEALIAEILELRDRKAHLLGYGCFADYATSRRMAGSGANALKFINDLHDRVKPSFLKDMEAVRRYKEEKQENPWKSSPRGKPDTGLKNAAANCTLLTRKTCARITPWKKLWKGSFPSTPACTASRSRRVPRWRSSPVNPGKRRKARWRCGIRTSCSMNCMMRKAGNTWVPFMRTGIRGTPSAPERG